MAKKPKAVREPIQVYLAEPDRALLEEIVERTGLPRAEILRRGIRRVGAEVLAGEHPMLRFLDELASAEWPDDMPDDVGERHDAYLTDRADA